MLLYTVSRVPCTTGLVVNRMHCCTLCTKVLLVKRILYTEYTTPRTYYSVVQIVHDGWKIIECTVVHCMLCTWFTPPRSMYYTVLFAVRNGSYVIEYTVVHSVQAVVYIKCISPSHYLHKYIHRYYPVFRIYSTSQQTVSVDGLQGNSQHRKN